MRDSERRKLRKTKKKGKKAQRVATIKANSQILTPTHTDTVEPHANVGEVKCMGIRQVPNYHNYFIHFHAKGALCHNRNGSKWLQIK